jgi:hypothetical protein
MRHGNVKVIVSWQHSAVRICYEFFPVHLSLGVDSMACRHVKVVALSPVVAACFLFQDLYKLPQVILLPCLSVPKPGPGSTRVPVRAFSPSGIPQGCSGVMPSK